MKFFLLILLICSFVTGSAHKSNPDATKQDRDTFYLNKQMLVRTMTDERIQSLTTISGDTILKNLDYYSAVKFLDIDADGYKDIRAFMFSNTPNQCENYLYDKEKKIFRLLENCDLDIQHLRGTRYYYSYNRTGCSDMNWESYLSLIENFKLVPVGYIYGQGCDFDINKYPQEILIYKIINPSVETKNLIRRFSYPKYIPDLGNKWKFIEDYWQKNWQKFKR